MKKDTKKETPPAQGPQLLKEAGFKATPGRIALVTLLSETREPLTVTAIQEKLSALSTPLNTVTLYRALEGLVDRGLVRKVDFQHPHAHYELVVGKKHHHHMVCNNCGDIEDIETCEPRAVEKSALKHSKKFASIKTHSLEFFGTCKKCAV